MFGNNGDPPFFQSKNNQKGKISKQKGLISSFQRLTADSQLYFASLRILYQKSIQGVSSKMKVNTPKGESRIKQHQKQQNKAQSLSTRSSESKKPKAETKGIEKGSQFPQSKTEKAKRGRPKLTENQRKQRCQSTQNKRKSSTGKEAPNGNSFPENLQGIDSFKGKQQQPQNKLRQKVNKKKVKINGKMKSKQISEGPQIEKLPSPQRPSKRDQKQLKKTQKTNKQSLSIKQELSEEISSLKKQQGQLFSEELLRLFRQKYSYYMIGDHCIVFPIEDNLFDLYPQLLNGHRQGSFELPNDISRHLSDNFCKQLQIWNILVQNASFFELKKQIQVSHISKMFSSIHNVEAMALWKKFHRFYINDILYHRYQDAVNQDYFSFISLWKYTDENGFFDQIFQTSWNKFLGFYISLVKSTYSNESLLQGLDSFISVIEGDLKSGKFELPSNYSELLDYSILLTNMCFETHTFKLLINGKMVYFRDNNKTKNELIEEKKSFESSLSELRDQDKGLVKHEKVARKAMKKEIKSHNHVRVGELQMQIDKVTQQRQVISNRKLFYHKKIIDLDNKIYELCCLPEFSNVWLLGQDRHKNLYWFVREQQEAIYRENHLTGSWDIIQGQNITKLHESLNPRGIREKKLYQKIGYYQQLGYIKIKSEENKDECHKGDMDVEKVQSCKEEVQQNNEQNMKNGSNEVFDIEKFHQLPLDSHQFDRFNYGDYPFATVQVSKLMILKSEWMMTKYLFERNSKWTNEQQRQQYINTVNFSDLNDPDSFQDLMQFLRIFNEKICVVEINIKIIGENDCMQVKTRKIQTKIWGINEKYKHFWYDYSRKCTTVSDLHFLASILYLTIERYVKKTRKPNNTKYFYKTVEFGQTQQYCELCQACGQLHSCQGCLLMFHEDCLHKHLQECSIRNKSDFLEDNVNEVLALDDS